MLSDARAQDIEPRSYSNTRIGVNFVISGYAYAAGGLSFDPALPITEDRLRTHTVVFGYARSLDVPGTSVKEALDDVMAGMESGMPEQFAQLDELLRSTVAT